MNKIDQKYFPIFRKHGSFQSYELFDGDATERENQKTSFLTGKTENPTLDYPKIDERNLERKNKVFRNLKKQIQKEKENNSLIFDIYTKK